MERITIYRNIYGIWEPTAVYTARLSSGKRIYVLEETVEANRDDLPEGELLNADGWEEYADREMVWVDDDTAFPFKESMP